MKNEVTIQTEQQLEIACPMALGLPEVAKENGLEAMIFHYQEHNLGLTNVGNRDGMYFIIFRDNNEKIKFQMMSLKNEKDKINELIDNIDEAGDTLNTKICMRPLNNITEENSFMVYQRCLRAIHNFSTVIAAYGEFGYKPPDVVAIETIYAINNFLDKRFNPNLTPELRKSMDEGMEKFIRNSVKRYKKNKPVRYRTLKPHMVRRDYFIKNGIACVNCGYSERFLSYVKERWNEEPDFVMYQEKKPYQVYADHSKAPKWIRDKFPELTNLWSDLKGYKMFRVTYPEAYREQMHAWMFDYFATKREQWDFIVPLEELDRRYKLYMVEIDDADLHNWISLCNYNGVKCAINHGEMGPVKDIQTFSFIYSEKDWSMVQKIKQRLSRELTGFDPLPTEFARLSEDGIRKMQEADRKYAEKMARKRDRKALKGKSSPEGCLDTEKSKIAYHRDGTPTEYGKKIIEQEKNDFMCDDDFSQPAPWKKHGYERGSGDLDM